MASIHLKFAYENHKPKLIKVVKVTIQIMVFISFYHFVSSLVLMTSQVYLYTIICFEHLLSSLYSVFVSYCISQNGLY